MRKSVYRVFDQVGYKLFCTVTEEDQKLVIWDLRRRMIGLSVKRKQRCDQMWSYCLAELRVSFGTNTKIVLWPSRVSLDPEVWV